MPGKGIRQVCIRGRDKWPANASHRTSIDPGALFMNIGGVLFGQKLANPILLRIELNIVLFHF